MGRGGFAGKPSDHPELDSHLDSKEAPCYLNNSAASEGVSGAVEDFHIVQVKPTHLPEIASLSQGVFSQESWELSALEKELRLDFSHCFVAESRSTGRTKVLGYLLFWMILDEVQILQVVTGESYRRRGVGRALLSKCLNWGREKGPTIFFLEVRGSNSGALVLYRAMGFREIALRRSYYRDPVEDAVIMMCGSGQQS